MPAQHVTVSKAVSTFAYVRRPLAVATLACVLGACGSSGPAPDQTGLNQAVAPGGAARAERTPVSAATPCVEATTACERWVTYGKGPARSMVYSTYALDTPNPKVTRALIMVHGALRNADHYFRTATTAAFLGRALDDTVVIAPHLIDRSDPRQENEVVWPEYKDNPINWRDGGVSVTDPGLTSFDFVDEIVRKLADKKNFTNLMHIVVAGHSAGGQFTNRYEMANKVDGTLAGITMSYAVANPSSYAWPSSDRPLPVGDTDPKDAYKEAMKGEEVGTDFKYGPFDASKVPTYNKWPRGMEALGGYAKDVSADQLRKQLAERKTTYLLGQVDVLPLGGFDSSPGALAQGPTRRARGEAYVKYIQDKLGAKPQVIIVSECGHNDRCIYTTGNVLPVIFPK
jgi:pimeloyl-ACP methyl ester carboxylesterase